MQVDKLEKKFKLAMNVKKTGLQQVFYSNSDYQSEITDHIISTEQTEQLHSMDENYIVKNDMDKGEATISTIENPGFNELMSECNRYLK